MSGLILIAEQAGKIAMDFAVATAGAAGVAFASKKILVKHLPVPMDLRGLVLLAA